jgi:hypothetical protein
VFHEAFGGGVERLPTGAPVIQHMKLELKPGVWFITATVSVGLSNVGVAMRLAPEKPGTRTLGGRHNGALSPHFSPATVIAHFDGVEVSAAEPVELVISFEGVPAQIPVLGQRTVSVTAFRKAELAAVMAPLVKALAARPAPAAKAEAAAPAAKPVAEVVPPPVSAPVLVAADDEAEEPPPPPRLLQAQAAKAAAKAQARPGPTKPAQVSANGIGEVARTAPAPARVDPKSAAKAISAAKPAPAAKPPAKSAPKSAAKPAPTPAKKTASKRK